MIIAIEKFEKMNHFFGECSAFIKERDQFLMKNRYIHIKKTKFLHARRSMHAIK
jgi:hypothetical protein